MNKAYKAVIDFANEKGLKIYGSSRTIYVKGSGKMFKGNPNNYVTEIVMPIE